MAFNIYFAGGLPKDTEVLLQTHNGNRLYSQLHERNSVGNKWIPFKKENSNNTSKLFVDSGAYSAHTKGKALDVDDYIDYLNTNVGMFDAMAQVDTIPGEFRKPKTFKQLREAPEKSWNNYLYMRERVLDKDALIPIFHMGEDFKWLQNMLDATFEGDKHIPYIGISPANDSTTKFKDRWLEKVFRIIRESNNPNVKTHAFGMTVLSQLERHPLYSADSTSPLMTAAMGNIMTKYGLISFARKDGGIKNFERQPKDVQLSIRTIAEEAGYTVEELATSWRARVTFNCQYCMDWAETYQFKGIKYRQKTLFTF